MVLCKLWTAEVASEAPLLQSAINHGLRGFRQGRLKPVHSEAVCKRFSKDKTYS